MSIDIIEFLVKWHIKNTERVLVIKYSSIARSCQTIDALYIFDTQRLDTQP